MKRLFTLRPWASAAIVLGLVAIPILASGVWRQSTLRSFRHSGQTSGTSPKLRAGVGTEVKLAIENASPEQVRSSIDTIDTFISTRAGLKMNEQVRARLTQMESDTLSGARARTPIPDYVDAITDTFVARMSTLTDDEIDYAGSILKSNGSIRLRSNGRFGLTEEEFPAAAKSLRHQCRQNDSATRAFIRAAFKEETDKRVGELSTGDPAQFGGAQVHGLTPAQALLITYSIVTDDGLAFSHAQVDKMARNPNFSSRGPDTIIPSVVKAYGPDGLLFPTPADLVFSRGTITGLLDRLAKGGN